VEKRNRPVGTSTFGSAGPTPKSNADIQRVNTQNIVRAKDGLRITLTGGAAV